MDSYKKNKLKIVFFIILLSMCIVLNITYVSVFLLESKYSFIWLWASKSSAKIYQLYYIAFIFNCLICIISLSIPVLLSKTFKKIILRLFWFLIIPILILTIRAFVGFIVFDLELYPFEPSSYVEQTDISSEYYSKMYCNYWNFGVDSSYSNPELCGRPN